MSLIFITAKPCLYSAGLGNLALGCFYLFGYQAQLVGRKLLASFYILTAATSGRDALA